ncbi:MAG TPA: outer membrane beta-barrel protein [Ohtaekwangia sp.]
MNSKKLRLSLILTLLGLSSYVMAQDATTEEETKPTFNISGSIDTYIHTSMGATEPTYGNSGPSTSFANLKGFSLGMANLIASYQGDKTGFTADLVFGPRGRDAVFAASYTDQRIINQLFAYIKLSDAVTLNIGQFNTFVGFEVISPAVNPNYSTSYLFSNGPFNHTGVRADFSFGDGLVAKLAIMNPTDIVEFNPVNTFTLGGQIGKTTDGGGVWLNLLYGDQDGKLDEDTMGPDDFSNGSLFQADVTAGFTISESFYLGANFSYQTIGEGEVSIGDDIEDAGNDASSFMGFAVYPKFTLSDAFALAIRAEYFSSTKFHPLAAPIGIDDEGDGNVIALTLSGNIKAGPLMFIPELRYDKTSEDYFEKKDGEATDSIISATLAAVYKF